jgi:hypothetical protein
LRTGSGCVAFCLALATVFDFPRRVLLGAGVGWPIIMPRDVRAGHPHPPRYLVLSLAFPSQINVIFKFDLNFCIRPHAR